MYKNLDEILDENGCFSELGKISGDKKHLEIHSGICKIQN